MRLEVRKEVIWRVSITGVPPRGDGRRNRTAEVPKVDLGRELAENVEDASGLQIRRSRCPRVRLIKIKVHGPSPVFPIAKLMLLSVVAANITVVVKCLQKYSTPY